MPRYSSAAAHDAKQVEDDQDVHDQACRLQRGRLADELVQLERDEQRGGDHRQPLGPALSPEEPDSLDELEDAVGDRARADQLDLAGVQAVQPLDDVVDEALLRIELEAAGEPVGEGAEVRAGMAEQVDAGCDEEQSAVDEDKTVWRYSLAEDFDRATLLTMGRLRPFNLGAEK